MNRRITAFALVALTALGAPDIRAQSSDAFAGWLGLIVTPVGALTPMGPPVVSDSSSRRLQARYGHWQFGPGDDNTSDIGLGMEFRSGTTRTTLEVGYALKVDCGECGTLMAGVDVNVPIAETARSSPLGVHVALNPAFGIGVPNSGGSLAFAAALNAPVSVAFQAGREGLVIPFISPGLGYGLLSGSSDATGAARAMLSGGVSVAGSTSSARVTLSFRRIYLEGAPTIYGIGVSLPR